MKNEEIVDLLKGIIANDLDINISEEELDENISLFEDGIGLDSIAVVHLITRIEKQFEIQINDNEISTKDFKSLTVLSKLIENKLQHEHH